MGEKENVTVDYTYTIKKLSEKFSQLGSNMQGALVVCLCGSTRFKAEMETARKYLTLRGYIVLGPEVYGHAGDELQTSEKILLDALHKRKIDLADIVLVMNVNGYVGESTADEIRYAEENGKKLFFLERPRFPGFNAYLAGSIFYEADLMRNTAWAKKLREAFPDMDLYSPVENTAINGVEGKKKFADARMVADADNARLDKTDVLIACIDGDIPPAGTCAEIGRFSEKISHGEHKFLVGICTDNRQCFLTHSKEKDEGGAAELGNQQYSYQNIYVTGLIHRCGKLVSNIDDAIAAIKEWLDNE